MVQVGVIMGSISDWETMQHACDMLSKLDIPYEKDVISAHRTPDEMFTYAKSARERGLKVIIAGAGGAAHLPGMIAAQTTLPVIGVPIQSKALNGLDSLLSIVQMPGGVPTATVAIGNSGAKNAGIIAAQIIGSFEEKVAERLKMYREELQENVAEMREDLAKE
ncbi:5-(carboxyamino)imidazole ribonucleotide mutase [Virgibacillus salinus]|uniref:N5-carboxyaminoimidazole ribonucleotide mutase n=1 Tax=Virgibacillus salinus TaxID=553311 RepID=A0A1H1GEJ8_9BACI|nr:5-(carboxyamino)imidazole ribonucleotide mutase [Virgibacillus salinus]SDR11674.1 5-(carboxyamino)imidazole ribonucleotide mutase [Virgibacillus salinus]